MNVRGVMWEVGFVGAYWVRPKKNLLQTLQQGLTKNVVAGHVSARKNDILLYTKNINKRGLSLFVPNKIELLDYEFV